jgi:cysteine desulfurase/selenocysteine lyase
MSIPRPDAFASLAADGQGADSDHTALIAALFRESFQPSKNLPAAPPSTVAGMPSPSRGVEPVGTHPAAGAASGPPSSSPAPTAATRDIGLNGGFPGATDSAPPVHPTVVAPETESESVSRGGESQPAAPSGTHQVNDVSSYEFGEPRFVAERLNARPQERPVVTDLASLYQNPSFPDQASRTSTPSSEAEFYFLQKPAAPAVAAASPLSSFDVEAVRRNFPALNQRVNGHRLIYLDNAATTHKPQAVIDATSQFYGRDNSNIHRAAHVLAERSTKLFEEGREKVRQFLGAADAKEIVFLRGTTEAINLVANSYGRKHVGRGDEIVLTKLEHHANIVPWQLLAEQTGAVIRVAPINDRGELILEEFARLLNHRTKIVSVTHVSNALGTINPVEQIIPLAHAVGAVVLVDGAQSTPHLPVNVQALNADFYVFSGHKIFGPTGIGALYGKRHLLESMPPWQGGGHMIQDVTFEKTIYRPAPEKFEAGTPDIAGVVGLGAAIDYMFRIGIPAIAAYEHALLEYATHALATVPGLRPIGTAHNKASVLSFVIPGQSNESIARQLDQKGIAVRAGHHCALPAQRHFGQDTTVRPSLAFYNTYEEVDILVSELRRLRR